MKICIFGNKTATKELINYLLDKNIKVNCLITLSNKAKDRHSISGQSNDLAEYFLKRGLIVNEIDEYTLSDHEYISFFESSKFDLGLCTGWQRIIPNNILNTFKYGVFGWHGSGFNLPNGKGRSPLNWSIRLGCKKIFHNCFQYNENPDEGDIFDIKKIIIDDKDYIYDLQIKVLEHIKESAVNLINSIINCDLKLIQQPKLPYILFPKLTDKSGLLSLKNMIVEDAINITRSCSHPFPGAYVRLDKDGKGIIRIWALRRTDVNGLSDKISSGQGIIINNLLYLSFQDYIVESENYEIEFFHKEGLKEPFSTF